MKAAFYTLGCKVNQYETQLMRQTLEQAGYEIVTADDAPDVFIINSCTVTGESDRKSRQILHRYRRLLPQAVLVLAGCMPQAFPSLAADLPQADVVIGNQQADQLPALIKRFLAEGSRLVQIEPHKTGDPYTGGSLCSFSGRTRAYLKIEDGCDRFCTYCIIPTARGRVRSKPLEQIRQEAEALASAGFREIVLVGINLSAWGREWGLPLQAAVAAACAASRIERVRLGSLEPDQIGTDTLRALAAEEKFCAHFHLSLQSGCDRTLRRMNRHYTAADYLALTEKIRSIFPCPGLTTDVMVGFPGETRQDHLDSVRFVEQASFLRAHIFAYSPRAGTPAYSMPDQIPKHEKERRSKQMQQAAQRGMQRFLASLIGAECLVLAERHEDGFLYGHAQNDAPVRLFGTPAQCGEILAVKIGSVEGDCLLAQAR